MSYIQMRTSSTSTTRGGGVSSLSVIPGLKRVIGSRDPICHFSGGTGKQADKHVVIGVLAEQMSPVLIYLRNQWILNFSLQ